MILNIILSFFSFFLLIFYEVLCSYEFHLMKSRLTTIYFIELEAALGEQIKKHLEVEAIYDIFDVSLVYYGLKSKTFGYSLFGLH